MKVLITGSACFIGSALSLRLRLLERGAKGIGGDNLNDDYDVPLTKAMERGVDQAGILAVPHRECVAAEADIRAPGAKNSVLSDLKSMLPAKAGAVRL